MINIPTMLARYLDSIDGTQPFDWHTNNCGHFAGHWWAAATGCNALLGLPMPATAEAASSWLVQQGSSLGSLVGLRLARSSIDPRLAQAGDVVIIGRSYATSCGAAGLGAALGICAGRRAAMLSKEGVVVFLPMVSVSSAFPLRGSQ